MSIMPNQSPQSGMSPIFRTIVFWVTLIALAVVLWQIASKNHGGNHPNLPADLIAAIIVVGVWVFASLLSRKFRRRPPPKNPENRPLG